MLWTWAGTGEWAHWDVFASPKLWTLVPCVDAVGALASMGDGAA
jgi:hypothetical protein